MKIIKNIKEHYMIYREQRNGHLEELKMIQNYQTGSLAGINKWTVERVSLNENKVAFTLPPGLIFFEFLELVFV